MQYCWNAGGYLAEFESLEEEKTLDSVLNIDSSYWIGLTDVALEGTWRWQESLLETSYTNWITGEPNNQLGDENCACKRYNVFPDGKWNDANCSVKDYAHALCKREK